MPAGTAGGTDHGCPTVSVVMPSRNQAGYLESAVVSVLSQDVTALDLCVADGASTDETPQRLARLAQRFGRRLRWQSAPDSGPAQDVNRALARSRGEIIGWLNADDCYAPGAIQSAVDFFAAHPAAVMVYGEAEHIDAAGKPLGRYPTRLPEETLSGFQAGCFICQPTVFLRRSVFAQVGTLDEGLATAFDFDLWLRIFQQFPGRIGYVDRVQAYSRLHAGCITRTQRRLVAEEAVRLLARYLGRAQDHWLRTYVNEALASYPFGDVRGAIQEHVAEFVAGLAGYLEPAAAHQLRQDLQTDARLCLARTGIAVDVYPDGWAPRDLELRMAGQSVPQRALRLHCQHAWPFAASLELVLGPSWAAASRMRIAAPGPFIIEIPLADVPPGADVTVRITADRVFVPRLFRADHDDGRGLAFIVRGLELV